MWAIILISLTRAEAVTHKLDPCRQDVISTSLGANQHGSAGYTFNLKGLRERNGVPYTKPQAIELLKRDERYHIVIVPTEGGNQRAHIVGMLDSSGEWVGVQPGKYKNDSLNIEYANNRRVGEAVGIRYPNSKKWWGKAPAHDLSTLDREGMIAWLSRNKGHRSDYDLLTTVPEARDLTNAQIIELMKQNKPQRLAVNDQQTSNWAKWRSNPSHAGIRAVEPDGGSAGWNNFIINEGTHSQSKSLGQTPKLYVTLNDFLGQMSPDLVNRLLTELQAHGFRGQLKTADNLMAWLRHDQIVIHGQTADDIALAERILRNALPAQVRNAERGLDVAGTSHNNFDAIRAAVARDGKYVPYSSNELNAVRSHPDIYITDPASPNTVIRVVDPRRQK